jgi:glutathione peroxidase
MKKIVIGMLLVFFAYNIQAQDFYNLQANTIDGKTYKFEELKGKKVLIVNTASKCGYTKQYADLQKLYEKYKNDGFVILGFPANDFMKQEPGSNEEIKEFCSLNYGVSFPMMSKISVKGKEMHPVYQWLTSKESNGFEDSKVKWNFQKYFIDEDGKLVAYFQSATKPFDDEIIKLIEN